MNKKTRVLFAGHDLGGCLAILPVLRKLRSAPGVMIRGVFRNDMKQSLPLERGCLYVSPLKRLFIKDVEQLFRSFRPALVIVGTSGISHSIDKVVMEIAYGLGIPSVAIIDSPANYKDHLPLLHKKNVSDDSPTWICTLSEDSKQDLFRAGVPKDRIYVTGNPHFDAFKPTPLPPKRNAPIVFFHQPFSELRKDQAFGYDERRVFKDVIEMLEALGLKQPVIVKIHPRTMKKNVYDDLIKKSGLHIRVETRMSSHALIHKARLVIGMNSAALLEAALSGRAVVSYQPGLRKPDPLVSNRMGLSAAVYKKGDLSAAIQRASNASNSQRHVDTCLIDNATENVLSMLHKLHLL